MYSAEVFHYQVGREEATERLDSFLAGKGLPVARSAIKRYLDAGKALVNGKMAKPSCRLKEGDQVAFSLPQPEPIEAVAEAIPIPILFEDEHLVVVNKPAGLSVHPGAGHPSGTLVNALLYCCDGRLSGIGGALRPGIVHRLDLDTSGVLVVAKNDQAHQGLAEAFKEKHVLRRYRAIVHRRQKKVLPPSGTFQTLIGRHPKDRKRFSSKVVQGKVAVTHYQLLEAFSQGYLVEAKLDTGRTHQIRVHFSDAGWPLIGDLVYGGRSELTVAGERVSMERQALHAFCLGFTHPVLGQFMEFHVPPPDDFNHLLRRLQLEVE